MDRRTAIKRTAVAGLGLSSAFISGVLSGCKPEQIGNGYQPLFFDRNKFKFLQDLSEILIPATETPGAVELGLAEWIDTIIKKCYTEENQKIAADLLDQVYDTFGGSATSKQVEETENSTPIDQSYQQVKQTIGSAYLATEYVGTELLNYLPIPGDYEACIPLSQTNGKAWTI